MATAKTYRIIGHVLNVSNPQNKRGAAGVRVEAWDKDLICNDLVGNAATDGQGAFAIEFTHDFFQELFFDRRPDLFFKVFRHGALVHSTEESVLWNVEAGDTQILIEVVIPDAPPPNQEPKPEPFAVRGQVRQADGSPLISATVRAFDKDFRSEEALGEAITNQSGEYEIKYTAEQFRRKEKQSADLIVRVFDRENRQLAVTPILFNALANQTVDISIPGDSRRPSEYEQLVGEITPLTQGVRAADFTEDDIAFLAGETGMDSGHIELLVIANQHARETELAGEVFYGLLRQNLPTDLLPLLSNNPSDLRRALESSLRDNITPARIASQIDSILATLQQLLLRYALRPAGKDEKPSLGDLLGASSLSRKQQESFLVFSTSHDGQADDFWNTLRHDPAFQTPGAVEELQLTLQLGALTQSNVPLVKALHNVRQQGAINSARDLVKLDNAAWTQLLNTPVNGQPISIPDGIPGDTPEEKKANYIRSMTDALRAAFPTAATAQSLAIPPAMDVSLVKTVLAHNPQFNPGDFLPDSLDWSGISDEDQARAKTSLELFRQELKMFPGLDANQFLALPDAAASQERIEALSAMFSNPLRDGVSKLLTNSPDLELHTTHIDTYVAEHAATAFRGIPEESQTAVVEQLKRTQRVFRVTSNPDRINDLQAEGLHSAHSIATIPRKTFIERFQNRWGGEAEAMKVHAQAQQITASTTALSAQVRQAMTDAAPWVLGPVPGLAANAVKQILNWETLFGSTSFCACGHCRSVYGPAAYFVDLLQFLRNSGRNKKNKTPLDVLLQRRPDLEYVKLSCENAETPLPYVDLVNEILESYVALGKPDASVAKDTGDVTADALRANPQYLNDAAYATLKKAIYPFALPFNRPLEVMRTYLEHLGGSRDQVMTTFHNNGTPSDLAIACEYLKISPEEHAILTGTDLTGAPMPSPPTLAEFYGYPAATTANQLIMNLQPVQEFLRRTGVSYPELGMLIKARFLNPLDAVTLSASAGADQCDLNQLSISPFDVAFLQRAHRFIRLWRKLGWQVWELDRVMAALGTADINDAFLLKLAQVKRMQTELGLPLNQLTTFWAALDTDGRDSLYLKLFQNGAVLKPVDHAFELSYATLLNSLPNVTFPDSVKDQITYDSAAKQLRFVGVMTDSQREDLLELSTESDFQLAVNNLYGARTANNIDLAHSGEPMSDHVNAILAALRINATDLVKIRSATGLSDLDPNTKAPLNLANLSALYRHATLARALRLSVNDFLSLIVLTGLDPFQQGDPASTVLFVDRVQKARQSPFSVSQLNYLYRDLSDPKRDIAPNQATVDQILASLQTALKKIEADTDVEKDPTGDLLRQKLAVVLDDKLIDPAMRLLDGTAVYSASLASQPGIALLSGLSAKISYDTAAQQLRFIGAMTDDERGLLSGFPPDVETAIQSLFQQPRDFIAANFSAFLDPAAAVANLINKDKVTPSERFDYILKQLMPYLQDILSRELITQILSDDLKLETTLTQVLLSGYQSAAALLKSQADPTKPAIADFQALVAPGVSPGAATKAAKNSYRLLHKVALLVGNFKMTVEEEAYLSSHGSDFAGADPNDPNNGAKAAPFDLNALPLDPSGFKPALFSQWERLLALFTLRDSLPNGEGSLIDVFAAGTPGEAETKLAQVTGWGPAELATLTGNNGFNFTAADFKNEVKIAKLQSCWALIKRFGVSAKQLFGWAVVEPDVGDAHDVQNTVRAKYDDDAWLTAAKPLNDVLRESGKGALIAYLLTDPGLRSAGVGDSSGLYEYFLIDVDMGACMMTSRIVQASAAVQLFVQRCLMNLEEGKADPSQDVSPSAIDTDQWRWMSQYRVWEANRKLFLYPENWILPELRDDKSPFFKELENELLQNDLTEETAEQAIMNYLEKLHEVERLDICGMYWQEEPEPDPLTGESTQFLHVFGRTFHTPPIYYYRRLAISTGVWTAWEKVPLDIQGDHLVPIVRNRRLYLYWLVFEEKSDESQDLGAPLVQSAADLIAWQKYNQDHEQWVTAHGNWQIQHDTWEQVDKIWHILSDPFVNKGQQPPLQIQEPMEPVEPREPQPPSTTSQPTLTHWEIKLAWSEYRQNKWTAKQMSSEFIKSPHLTKTLGQVIKGWNKMNALGKELFLKVHYYPPQETIVQLYLPGQKEHFVKTSVESGELVFEISRRYWKQFQIFDHDFSPGTQFKSFESLGHFRTACATEVKTENDPNEPKSKPFHELAVPDGATNSFMTLADETDLTYLGSTSKGKSLKVLNSIPTSNLPYRLLDEHQVSQFALEPPFQRFFYQDREKTYYVHPPTIQGPLAATKLQFDTFFHPHVCSFIVALNQDGVSGLLKLENQLPTKSIFSVFGTRYAPSGSVQTPYPLEDVDFSSGGAYSIYNWELFFHIPLLIATRLSQNQKFEEAQHWFHYIFDPTGGGSSDTPPKCFWKVLPFYQNTEDGRIEDLLKLLYYQGSDPNILAQKAQFEAQVKEWRERPFNPHLIARLRPIAYQKTVVQKYLDNLIAWGDYLFSQDTRESVNQATLLYVLASEILGPRPQQITGAKGAVRIETYHDMKQHLDNFSNALMDLENQFQFTNGLLPGQLFSGGIANILGNQLAAI